MRRTSKMMARMLGVFILLAGWVGTGAGIALAAEASLEAGQIATPLGTLDYVRRYAMEASGYYPGPESTGPWADGFTSAGLRAGYGVVAVDPDLIPLGTMLYIPGYGVAIAGDVGSAIKGLKIDLGFDSYREALFFGRRPMDVYVIEAGWLQGEGPGVYPEPWLSLASRVGGESGGP